MSEAEITEILKLPAGERFRLAELIWESLLDKPSDVPLSDAHRSVVDERVAEHEQTPDQVVSRDELMALARQGQ